MSRSITVFIGLILASLVLLTGLAVLTQRLTNQSAQVSAPAKKSMQTPIPKRAFTTLTAIPSKEEVSVGENFTIAIQIATGENTVGGVQLELSYDPAILAIGEISQGDFFAKPIIYANKNDSKKGEITYALGSFDGKKGVGTVAIMKAVARKKSGGLEVLHIKPTTLVTEFNNTESVLNARKGAILVIR